MCFAILGAQGLVAGVAGFWWVYSACPAYCCPVEFACPKTSVANAFGYANSAAPTKGVENQRFTDVLPTNQ